MSGPGRQFRQWAARWRVALRYGRRDARRHWGRTILVVTMVSLPVFTASAILTWMASRDPVPATVVSHMLGPDLAARIDFSHKTVDGQDLLGNERGSYEPNTGGLADDGSPLRTADYTERLKSALPDDATVTPVALDHVGLTSLEAHFDTDVHQTDLSRPEIAAVYRLSSGRLPDQAHEIALDADVADHLGVGTGDAVHAFTGASKGLGMVTITGLLADRDATTVQVVFDKDGPMPVRDTMSGPALGFVNWYVTSDQPVTWEAVQAINAMGSTVLSRQVALDPPAAASPDRAPDRPLITAVIGAVGVGLVQAVFLVMPAFAIGRRTAVRSLALLAAAGADRATIRRAVLASAITAGSVASALGIALGIAAAAAIPLTGLRDLPNMIVSPWLLLLLPGGTLLAALAALPSAVAASRTDVVAALGHRPQTDKPRQWVLPLGIAAVTCGLVAVAFGAVQTVIPLFLGGIILAELGVIIAVGTILELLSRGAPGLPVATRFALRNSVRHRSRTTPAIAAAAVAVATAVGSLTFWESEAAFTATIGAEEPSRIPYAIALLATIMALVATWTAAGLVTFDSRPELTTFEAVGATPGFRRRVAAAQAGVVSAVGTAVGLPLGVILGSAFVALLHLADGPPYESWPLRVPLLSTGALAVILTLVAMGGAWLFTRTRIPVSRRRD